MKRFKSGAVVAAALFTIACGALPRAHADILWDQPYDGMSGAIVSQVFPDLPTFSTKSFDDFVVGAGGWNINMVTIFGTEFGNPAFNIAVVLSITAIPDFNAPPLATALGTEVGPDLVFTGLNITLAPGTYWISAWVNRSFTDGGQWFWSRTTPILGSQHFIHNPGGGFGFGTVPLPGGVIPPSSDLAFRIEGTTAIPEPASLTLLGFGTVGLLGYGWRRRKQPA
jgi:PEP-CTERM motif